jgi:hypothetical protein
MTRVVRPMRMARPYPPGRAAMRSAPRQGVEGGERREPPPGGEGSPRRRRPTRGDVSNLLQLDGMGGNPELRWLH